MSNMPWPCAILVISLIVDILVVLSARRLSEGCGVCWAAEDSRDSSTSLVTGSSFQ